MAEEPLPLVPIPGQRLGIRTLQPKDFVHYVYGGRYTYQKS